jgi:hypothetical protein
VARIARLELPQPRTTALGVHGEVLYVDGFGNLVTNIGREIVERMQTRFSARSVWVRIGRSAPIELRRAYGEAPRSALLAIVGSFELLEVAVRDGSAAARLRAGAGTRVVVRPGDR